VRDGRRFVVRRPQPFQSGHEQLPAPRAPGRLAGAGDASPGTSGSTSPHEKVRVRQPGPRVARSLDHLVGAEQHGLGDGETERLCRLRVDHQLELGWLLDRKIGRLGTLEDLVDVPSRLTK
jgi:hypothetical protein